MSIQTTYHTVADYFIALSNETHDLITNLKLQKLTYYAQAWHLAIRNVPMFDEDFEAWVHGPVLPALYNQYKPFSWKPILREDIPSFSELENHFDESTKQFLSDLCDEYFGLSAYQLESLTHNEAPWKNARAGIPEDQPSSAIIKKEDMQLYYAQYIDHGEA